MVGGFLGSVTGTSTVQLYRVITSASRPVPHCAAPIHQVRHMDSGVNNTAKLQSVLETALRFWSATCELKFWQRAAIYFQIQSCYAEDTARLVREANRPARMSAYSPTPTPVLVADAIRSIQFVKHPPSASSCYDVTVVSENGSSSWAAVDIAIPANAAHEDIGVMLTISFVMQIRDSALIIKEVGGKAAHYSGATIVNRVLGENSIAKLTGGSRQEAELWEDASRLCHLFGPLNQTVQHHFSENNLLGRLLTEAFTKPFHTFDPCDFTREMLADTATYKTLDASSSFRKIHVTLSWRH